MIAAKKQETKTKKETKTETKIKDKKKELLGNSPETEEMMKAGVHLGHQISKLHPNMADNVVGIRNTVHIIDLQKTWESLNASLTFLDNLLKKDGSLLIVSTKPPLRDLVRNFAKESGIAYVVERWLGGTFTNFKGISKRIEHYKKMRQEKEGGEFGKFGKKERVMKNRELTGLTKKFEGISEIKKIPEVIFICDIVSDEIAIREARKTGVKTIGIVDTNANPEKVDYPIFANDDAISSVKYILEKVKKTIEKNKKEK